MIDRDKTGIAGSSGPAAGKLTDGTDEIDETDETDKTGETDGIGGISGTIKGIINYSFNEIPPHPDRILEYLPSLYEKTAASPAAYACESEEESGAARKAESASSGSFGTEEAEETFRDTQYAMVLGAFTDVSNQERETFDKWILFNPAEFGLIQALHSFTREVNYAPLR